MIRADKRRRGLGPGADRSPGFNPSNARGRPGAGASANTRQVNAKCAPVLWCARVCIGMRAACLFKDAWLVHTAKYICMHGVYCSVLMRVMHHFKYAHVRDALKYSCERKVAFYII